MSGWLGQLTAASGGQELPLLRSFALLLHASAIGFYLLALEWRVSRRTAGAIARGSSPLLASASVLFVCVGMASVMILVNDNLARAFAVGAAIALIRFRVKMVGKFLGIALLYAVITGMACGLSRVDIAWAVALLFGILLFAVLGIDARIRRRELRAGEGRRAA
ncbi:MAG: hypothetical protein NDJ89_04545 [Oligoflexia bacterium]|nr:hypothetical protein [Oligoflexia bacterium]